MASVDSDSRSTTDLTIATIGNVDSGKSTLVGVLTKSVLDDGRGFARSKVFNFGHEQENGRTSSIAHEIMGFHTHASTTPDSGTLNVITSKRALKDRNVNNAVEENKDAVGADKEDTSAVRPADKEDVRPAEKNYSTEAPVEGETRASSSSTQPLEMSPTDTGYDSVQSSAQPSPEASPEASPEPSPRESSLTTSAAAQEAVVSPGLVVKSFSPPSRDGKAAGDDTGGQAPQDGDFGVQGDGVPPMSSPTASTAVPDCASSKDSEEDSKKNDGENLKTTAVGTLQKFQVVTVDTDNHAGKTKPHGALTAAQKSSVGKKILKKIRSTH